MGEPRRIELTQVSGQEKKEKPKKRTRNVRFKLSLEESTDQTCPEFSYTELLKKSLVENATEESNVDPDDPFANKDQAEHDQMVALAKSYESKYGQAQGQTKPKHRRVNDLVDLGDGYDESDPFIDNSDAYDELVPECLTTKHGGFYINSGQLDFKEVAMSLDAEDIEAILNKKRRKKRTITSDTDSEKETKKRGRPKKKLFGEELLKKRKKRLASDGSEKPLKKKKLIHVRGKPGRPPKEKKLAPTVAQLLGQTNQMNGLAGQHNGTHQPSEKLGLSSATATASDSEESTGEEGYKQSAMTQEHYDNIFDAVIKNSSQDSSMSPKPSSCDLTTASSSPVPIISQNHQALPPENAAQLPESVQGTLLDTIVTIKLKARESAEGKCKFFTPEVNSLLLKIENLSRQTSAAVRSHIYAHLAAHLPCGKDTLIKRAKKLRITQHDDKLQLPIAKLREAVHRAMPSLLERYQVELQATEKAKQERKMEGGATMLKGEGSTESDEEGAGEGVGEGADKQKRIMAPRKKFEWTPEIRSLLCDVVRIKMELYEMQKIRSQAPEDYLRSFLDAEIKPLWPQGWIQTRMLFKESRMVHHRWTMEKSRTKRPMGLAVLTSPSSATAAVAPSQSMPSVLPSPPVSRTIPMLDLPTESKPLVHNTQDKTDIVHRVTASSESAQIGSTASLLLDMTEVSSTSDARSRHLQVEAGSMPSALLSMQQKSIAASMLASPDAELKYLQERALKLPGLQQQTPSSSTSQTVKSSSSAEFLDKFMEFAAGLRAQDKIRTLGPGRHPACDASGGPSDIGAKSPVTQTTSSASPQSSSSAAAVAAAAAADLTMSKAVHDAWLSVGRAKSPSSSQVRTPTTSSVSNKTFVTSTSSPATDDKVVLRSEPQDQASLAMSLLEQQLDELQGMRALASLDYSADTSKSSSANLGIVKATISSSPSRSQAHPQGNNIISSSTNQRASLGEMYKSGSYKMGQVTSANQTPSFVPSSSTVSKPHPTQTNIKPYHANQLAAHYTSNHHNTPGNPTPTREPPRTAAHQPTRTSPVATSLLSSRQESGGFNPSLPSKQNPVSSHHMLAATVHKPIAAVRASHVSSSVHNPSVKLTPSMSSRVKEVDPYTSPQTLASSVTNKPFLVAAMQSTKPSPSLASRQPPPSTYQNLLSSKYPASAVAKPIPTSAKVTMSSPRTSQHSNLSKSGTFGGLSLEEIQAKMLGKSSKPPVTPTSHQSRPVTSPGSGHYASGDMSPLSSSLGSPVWPTSDQRHSPAMVYTSPVGVATSNRALNSSAAVAAARRQSPVSHLPPGFPIVSSEHPDTSDTSSPSQPRY